MWQQVNAIEANPDSNEAKQDACNNIQCRHPKFAAPQKRHGLKAERGEGRETAQKTSKEQESCTWAKQLKSLSQSGKYAGNQAADDVDRERTYGNFSCTVRCKSQPLNL